MTMELASTLLQETLIVTLKVAAPMLAAALFVGLAISVLQTATQVNEQTLTFVPKIVIVLGTFAALFPWIMGTLVTFGHRLMDLVADRIGT